MARLKDLIEQIDLYKSDKIKSIDFNKWVNENIKIKSYMDIKTKCLIVSMATERFNSEMTFEDENTFRDECYKTFELSLVFDILFAYTDIVVPSNYRNEETYDKIVDSLFYIYILDICGRDYEKMKYMYERQTGINNISTVFALADIFGLNVKVEDVEKMRDIINEEVDGDKLKSLVEISRMNDPIMAKVVDRIEKEAVKDVLEKA